MANRIWIFLVITALKITGQFSEEPISKCYMKHKSGGSVECNSTISFSCQSNCDIKLQNITVYSCATGTTGCTCSDNGEKGCDLQSEEYIDLSSLYSCNANVACNVSSPLCSFQKHCLVVAFNYTCLQRSSEVSQYETTSSPTDQNGSSSSVTTSPTFSLSTKHNESTGSWPSATHDSPESTSYTSSTTLNSSTDALFEASDDFFPTNAVAAVSAFVILSGVIIAVMWFRKKRGVTKPIQDRKVKLHIVVNEGYMDHRAEVIPETNIPDTQPRVVDTGNEYLELSEVDGPKPTANVPEDVEYNVLNLKTLPVKADPTYGHLACVGNDVSSQYSHVTRHQTSGATDDTYAQSGIVEDTYAHTGVVGDIVDHTYAHTSIPKAETVEDSTYNTLHY